MTNSIPESTDLTPEEIAAWEPPFHCAFEGCDGKVMAENERFCWSHQLAFNPMLNDRIQNNDRYNAAVDAYERGLRDMAEAWLADPDSGVRSSGRELARFLDHNALKHAPHDFLVGPY